MPKRAKINKPFFQGAIAEKGTTQRRLAMDMGLDPSALSLVFSGRRQMKLLEAASISRLLGIPLSEVLCNAGIDPPKANAVPLRGFVDNHGEVHMLDKPEGIVDCPVEMPEGALAIQCRTAMSGLEFMDGWLLFLPPPASNGSAVAPDAVGRLCIVKKESGLTLLGYLKRGYQAGKFNVHVGDAVASNVKVEWAVPIKLALMG